MREGGRELHRITEQRGSVTLNSSILRCQDKGQ